MDKKKVHKYVGSGDYVIGLEPTIQVCMGDHTTKKQVTFIQLSLLKRKPQN